MRGLTATCEDMDFSNANTGPQQDAVTNKQREHTTNFYTRIVQRPTATHDMLNRQQNVAALVGKTGTPVYLSFRRIGQNYTTSVTKACAGRPGAATSVSRRRREHRILLAGGGRRASRSHTLAASHAHAASQAFERMHMLFCHRVKTLAHDGAGPQQT